MSALWCASDPMLTVFKDDIHDMANISIFSNCYKAISDRNALNEKCSDNRDVMQPILESF